jgi:hypothetical protein
MGHQFPLAGTTSMNRKPLFLSCAAQQRNQQAVSCRGQRYLKAASALQTSSQLDFIGILFGRVATIRDKGAALISQAKTAIGRQ